MIARRRLLASGTLLGLSGCDRLSQAPRMRGVLHDVDVLDCWLQRRAIGEALAREYPLGAISRVFRANGSTSPRDAAYRAMAASGFAQWRLHVDGLVNRPLALSLADLRAMPSRTQVTRHDCVEGWSCIGEWQGVRLATVLARAGLRSGARYVMFHCADAPEQTLDGTGQYYESIDLFDAVHPQTILAYAMNGAALAVPYGAPLRLRVERQLGYKMAKYLMHIRVVDSFAGFGRGCGGFWEDRGYDWYAGI